MVQKRIVVCCDGTWQSATTAEKNVPSNVSRLCRLLAREGKDANGQPVPQVVYYDSGIGTGDISRGTRVFQGGTGAGINTNIIEAYNFVVLNYQKGDEIFCFGFSRGAYTARSVAGFITDFGICDPEDLIHLHQAWAVYQGNTSKAELEESQSYTAWLEDTKDRNAAAFLNRADFDQKETRKIKAIGVWDTVGALGVPDLSLIQDFSFFSKEDKNGFHNVRLTESECYQEHIKSLTKCKGIENAFQALALDEHRKPFEPTLFRKLRDDGDKITLKQVWFPGVHINCGGGSDDQLKTGEGDFEEMANITLAWMIEQVSPLLAFNKSKLQEELKSQDVFRANFGDKQQAGSWIPWKKAIKIDMTKIDTTRGYGTGPFIDSAEEAKYFRHREDRTPGMYDKEHGDLSKEELDQETVTNEEIHPVAAFRNLHAKDINYTPRGLGKWERRKRSAGDGYEWRHKENGRIIPEYKIPKSAKDGTNINLERVVIADEAKKFFTELDAVTKAA